MSMPDRSDRHSTQPPTPSRIPALGVRQGPRAGAVFPLPMGITRFGRDADCDVVLDDPTVSGRHAEFDRADSGVALRDAGSFNGTYLNRNLCHHATLTDGDEVWIGRFHFRFSDAYADHSRPGRPPASSGNDVA